jgi:hypothetical protein
MTDRSVPLIILRPRVPVPVIRFDFVEGTVTVGGSRD